MALYFYQAFSKEGKKITGYLDAPTPQKAREQLAKMGIYPTKIELTSDSGAKQPFYKRLFQRGIKLKDKIFFTKQLSILLKSGVPLVQALDLLIEQTEGRLRSIIIDLRDGIKEGLSLADGLAKYPAVFDSIYVQLTKAGESIGKLEVILDRLTQYSERSEEIRKKVSSALRYPMIQLVVIVLVVIGLLLFVVPEITNVFKDMATALPLPTRILMSLSDFFINHYILLAVILGLLALSYQALKRTEYGEYLIDKIKLKLPIIGYFSKTGAIVQFSRTLGMLVEGGVNLAESLNIVVKIIDNKILVDSLEKAKENIIKQTQLFPAVAIYLINTGEQSGELDTMLLTVAQYYEDDLRETADGLASLLTPIMLLVMAAVVGFVILSVMMPIQQITSMAATMAEK
jgi:type II secretory pathway component PulF